jgi:ornithine cyclodeaminase
MIYLSDEHVSRLKLSWPVVIGAVRETVGLLLENEYVQPVKPYLRYKNKLNRIIAMPAYVGGTINKSGIKWIASFPGNIAKGLPRANSVTILNEADTGIPFCIINTTRISAIRTAGVSGLIAEEYLKRKNAAEETLEVGIIGFGPIGEAHLDMLYQTCFDRIKVIRIYDLRPITLDHLPAELAAKIELAGSWQQVYESADIFITCTVSSERYIDRAPKKGSLQLNVSLRDYQPSAFEGMQRIVVDDWEEICRENTDIEMMHLQKDLQREETFSLSEHSLETIFDQLASEDVLMFNPMGMAIFDIAVGWYCYKEAKRRNINIPLD